MANSLSAKKRIKQNETHRIRNRARKTAVKRETRKFTDALQGPDLQLAQEAFVRLQKTLDKVAARGTLHKNTVARRKSRLCRQLNAAVAAAK